MEIIKLIFLLNFFKNFLSKSYISFGDIQIDINFFVRPKYYEKVIKTS
jgi:hypothetical protein